MSEHSCTLIYLGKTFKAAQFEKLNTIISPNPMKWDRGIIAKLNSHETISPRSDSLPFSKDGAGCIAAVSAEGQAQFLHTTLWLSYATANCSKTDATDAWYCHAVQRLKVSLQHFKLSHIKSFQRVGNKCWTFKQPSLQKQHGRCCSTPNKKHHISSLGSSVSLLQSHQKFEALL